MFGSDASLHEDGPAQDRSGGFAFSAGDRQALRTKCSAVIKPWPHFSVAGDVGERSPTSPIGKLLRGKAQELTLR